MELPRHSLATWRTGGQGWTATGIWWWGLTCGFLFFLFWYRNLTFTLICVYFKYPILSFGCASTQNEIAFIFLKGNLLYDFLLFLPPIAMNTVLLTFFLFFLNVHFWYLCVICVQPRVFQPCLCATAGEVRTRTQIYRVKHCQVSKVMNMFIWILGIYCNAFMCDYRVFSVIMIVKCIFVCLCGLCKVHYSH